MDDADLGLTPRQLLWLLKLASPGLPVGAYAYSEGIEALVARGSIAAGASLQSWLEDRLRYGTIRIEAALMLRGRASWQDPQQFPAWNAWLSASWETEELRLQSWQMGRSLARLLGDWVPESKDALSPGSEWNWAIVWGAAMASKDIPAPAAALAFLQAWAANLIGVGVKLVPLGQTTGQQIDLRLQASIREAVAEILAWDETDLACCDWGSALASLSHQTQRVRLFRS